ncbi:hypothetical protein L6452_36405 [Arctium lappa]|uniref:Uncharacterized protein n=1 Tax=Arctium lappa TaxID=4217 RepID=A0ACB8Y8H5_ARCLA|nr:hypothetical protein L6452_36405 [Arctium lappa]
MTFRRVKLFRFATRTDTYTVIAHIGTNEPLQGFRAFDGHCNMVLENIKCWMEISFQHELMTINSSLVCIRVLKP